MTEEFKVVKVRLLIEYSRLLDCGDMNRLSNQGRQDEHDRLMKMNRELVAAKLGETRLRLKSLSKMSLEYGMKLTELLYCIAQLHFHLLMAVSIFSCLIL